MGRGKFMEVNGDWPCWEIMKCEGTEDCPARKNPKKPCWEIASKMGDYRSAFNVCKDCIVYLLKQEDTIFSDKEIQGIMKRKGACAMDVSQGS